MADSVPLKTYTLSLCMTGLDAFELEAVDGLIGELKSTALMRKMKAMASPHEDSVMQEAILQACDQEAARADRIRAALSSEEEGRKDEPGKICVDCFEDAMPGLALCEGCLQHHRDATARRVEACDA
jgi:hypothetical protein